VNLFTVVSGEYRLFVPLFKHCAQKAYPEYNFQVFEHDSSFSPDMRFLVDPGLEGNTLIIDVDFLLFREKEPIEAQRLRAMDKYGLTCYHNYQSHPKRCPGVHFVTNDWWQNTKTVRDTVLAEYETGKRVASKDSDEYLIYEIVAASGLPVPPQGINRWWHGIHLGAYRKDLRRDFAAAEYTLLIELLEDKEFTLLAAEARSKSKMIHKIFKNLSATFKRR